MSIYPLFFKSDYFWHSSHQDGIKALKLVGKAQSLEEFLLNKMEKVKYYLLVTIILINIPIIISI